ncbi:MAG: XkdF-like putative serine protease domain-containing protein [bacterium JZ-2024 1]
MTTRSEKSGHPDPAEASESGQVPGCPDGASWMTVCPASPLVVLAEKSETRDTNDDSSAPPLRVLGIVYEPGVVDAQGDWTDAEVIKEAAHAFLGNGARLRRMHREDIPRSEAVLAESFIAPVDLQFNGLSVRKGAWVVVVRILGRRLRDEVISGKLAGFSMGGYGWREPAPPPENSESAHQSRRTYRITRFIPIELSLVDHPANQRPFVALKSEAPTDPSLPPSARVTAVLQPIADLQAGWLSKAGSIPIYFNEEQHSRRDLL